MTSVYEFSAKALDGRRMPLSEYQGMVLLVVNTASKCGFTPQYAGLEQLHQTYGPRNFAVLGFPCNQFGNQEPGDEAYIARFCSTSYHVSFPMFAKVDVNGEHEHPLFRFLKSQKRGLLGTESIKWNFTKFLIDRKGQPTDRFGPGATPAQLTADIERLIEQSA